MTKMKQEYNIWKEFFELEPTIIELKNIYLDPNNPRLEEPSNRKVNDSRIDEKTIQDKYMDKIKTKAFGGITDLTESIKTSGFWTIDRIVLREFKTKKFVVVEGNRRVAALKTLKTAHDAGEITLPKNIFSGIKKFETLVYRGTNPEIAWIIQGFRHTPGIKAWKKYPLAKFLAEFEKKSKKTLIQVSEIFSGLRRKEISKLIRSYYGFEQAKKDQEYGDLIEPEQFGHFYEIIMEKPAIKEWVSWNDSKRKFNKPENLKKYLEWATAAPGQKNKIDISITTRDIIAELLSSQNKKLFEKFENAELSLKECEEYLMKEDTKREVLDISESITFMEKAILHLTTLPIAKLQVSKSKEATAQRKLLTKKLHELDKIIRQQIKNLKLF